MLSVIVFIWRITAKQRRAPFCTLISLKRRVRAARQNPLLTNIYGPNSVTSKGYRSTTCILSTSVLSRSASFFLLAELSSLFSCSLLGASCYPTQTVTENLPLQRLTRHYRVQRGISACNAAKARETRQKRAKRGKSACNAA